LRRNRGLDALCIYDQKSGHMVPVMRRLSRALMLSALVCANALPRDEGIFRLYNEIDIMTAALFGSPGAAIAALHGRSLSSIMSHEQWSPLGRVIKKGPVLIASALHQSLCYLDDEKKRTFLLTELPNIFRTFGVGFMLVNLAKMDPLASNGDVTVAVEAVGGSNAGDRRVLVDSILGMPIDSIDDYNAASSKEDASGQVTDAVVMMDISHGSRFKEASTPLGDGDEDPDVLAVGGAPVAVDVGAGPANGGMQEDRSSPSCVMENNPEGFVAAFVSVERDDEPTADDGSIAQTAGTSGGLSDAAEASMFLTSDRELTRGERSQLMQAAARHDANNGIDVSHEWAHFMSLIFAPQTTVSTMKKATSDLDLPERCELVCQVGMLE
jgi:hypothetical protein